MNKTVVGLFDSHEQAENAVRDIVGTGVSRDQVSVVARDSRSGEVGTRNAVESGSHESITEGTGIGTNTAAGAVFGGLGGLLIGLGALAIPGIGPIVAAGPLAAALAGMGIGAAGGAVIGALKEAGIPEEEAHLYAESVRRGSTLVTVRADDADVDRISDIMDRHGAIDTDERSTHYRSAGWSRFEETDTPYVGVNEAPIAAGTGQRPITTSGMAGGVSSDTVSSAPSSPGSMRPGTSGATSGASVPGGAGINVGSGVSSSTGPSTMAGQGVGTTGEGGNTPARRKTRTYNYPM